MQTGFSKILSGIFKYITLFGLFFVWCNFYIHSLIWSVVVAILLSLIIGNLCGFINKKRYNKINITNKEKNQIQEISGQFLFCDKNTIINFFYGLLQNKYSTINKNKDGLTVENNNTKTLFIPLYHSPNLLASDVISSYITAKKTHANKLIIACVNYDDEVKTISTFVKDISIILLNENQTYKLLLQPQQIYPNFNIELKKVEKLKYRELKKVAFNKHRTKGYFFSGLLLLLSSFFTRYNVYYVVFSSLLFIFALYSYFNSSYNKVDTSELF